MSVSLHHDSWFSGLWFFIFFLTLTLYFGHIGINTEGVTPIVGFGFLLQHNWFWKNKSYFFKKRISFFKSKCLFKLNTFAPELYYWHILKLAELKFRVTYCSVKNLFSWTYFFWECNKEFSYINVSVLNYFLRWKEQEEKVYHCKQVVSSKEMQFKKMDWNMWALWWTLCSW